MKFPDAKVPDALVTAGRVAIVADFAVQIIADSLRSHGIRHTWLVICQVYFVILGALTCVLLLAAAQQLAPGTKLCGRESSPWRAHVLPRPKFVGRGDAAAATWIFRGFSVAAATWIFRG